MESARPSAQAIDDLLVPNWCLAYLALITIEQGDMAHAGTMLRELERDTHRLPSRQMDRHPLSLGIVATLATRVGEARSTALLLGALAADPRATAVALPETAVFERAKGEARQQIGVEAFDEAWRAGSTLGPDGIDAEIDTVLTAAEHQVPDKPEPAEPSLLTPREQEVLQLLIQGRTNPEIAADLFISRRTATAHVSSILGKLGVTSRSAAVTRAFRMGLV